MRDFRHVPVCDARGRAFLRDGAKALELRERVGRVAFVGAGKVAHQPAHANPGPASAAIDESAHLVGLEAGAPHPGVDLYVHGDRTLEAFGGAGQGLEGVGPAERRLESMRDDRLGLFGQASGEQHEPGPDAGFEEREGLGHACDAERVVAEVHERARHPHDAVPVGVALDDGPEWCPLGDLGEQPQIVGQPVEMDLDPRLQTGRRCGHAVAPPRSLFST
jgi:hypothetical protein